MFTQPPGEATAHICRRHTYPDDFLFFCSYLVWGTPGINKGGHCLGAGGGGVSMFADRKSWKMGRADEKKKVGKTSSGNNWIYLQERWKLISEVNLGTQTLLLKSTDSSSLGPLSNSKQNESHHPRLHSMSVSFTLALIPAWLRYITHIISFQGLKHRDRSYPKPAVPPSAPSQMRTVNHEGEAATWSKVSIFVAERHFVPSNSKFFFRTTFKYPDRRQPSRRLCLLLARIPSVLKPNLGSPSPLPAPLLKPHFIY